MDSRKENNSYLLFLYISYDTILAHTERIAMKGCNFMRLERLSDTQIRCTLTSTDLSDHHIDIEELTYGSENARNLFREMLTQASYELDFNVENVPLMIEAIPLPDESLMLLVTKIEDPEELDTRFAKFSPFNVEDIDLDIPNYPPLSNSPRADDILSLLTDLEPTKSDDELNDPISDTAASPETNADFYCVYSFASLDEVSNAARVIANLYTGTNSLYKNAAENRYYLVIHKSEMEPEAFNRICNILSEYSTKEQQAAAAEAYYQEHLECIIHSNAISIMKNL